MNRKSLLCMLFSLLTGGFVLAQRTVSGTISDALGPLPGASVMIKGTTSGTVSAIDGSFAVSVPDDDAVLAVSFVGYITQRERVAQRSVINFTLSETSKTLYEVVVTALGFKESRDKIASTYSKIEADKLVQPVENKIIDGMAGKAAGVNINATSGDPGAGSNIQIRGVSSLGGTSQPLIVVDGVPLNNDNIPGSGDSNPSAGVSQQSRLNDLNPEDIESFQVFKGASAGALYGSRALNGVIVITTKQGAAGKFNATLSFGVSIDQVSYKHPLQKTFGQGTNGKYDPTSSVSWGDIIADRSGDLDEVDKSGQFFQSLVSGDTIFPITGKNSRAIYADENFDKIFGLGVTSDNKFTISSGNEKGSYYLSGGYLSQNGIVKGSDYKKANFSASWSQNISKKLSARFKANYINTRSNRIQQGSNVAGLYLGLLRMSPDFDITDYIGNYHTEPKAGVATIVPSRQRSYRRYLGNKDNASYNNPLWTIKEQRNTARMNRLIGTGQFVYNWNDHISSMIRGGVDFYVDSRVYFFPWYTAGSARRYGLIYDETINNQEINADFITSFNYRIVDKLDADVKVGFGLNDRLRKINFTEAANFTDNFRSPLNPFELAPKENISSETTRTMRRNIRLYGTATFSYADQLVLALGGAFEKHSVLPKSNNGFFYPSVELGWQFSQLFNNLGKFSFGKLRLTYGQVANVPLPHKSQTLYEVGTFSSFSDGIRLEDFGGGYKLEERLGTPNLKPEIKTEYEVGLDLRFFENRLALSTTYYRNETKDVLLDVPISPSLGFVEVYGNGATITNEGFEAELQFDFLDHKDWKAYVALNFSTNKNLVTYIQGGGIIDFTNNSKIQSVAIEGHPLGVLYTQGALRNEDGSFDLDDNGFPQLDKSGNRVVGDPNPDWRGGIQLGVSYKNLSLSALFDTSQGNDMAQRTRFVLANFGTHTDVGNMVTLTEDLKNIKGDVIPAGTTVRGNIGDFGGGKILLDEQYYRTFYGFGDGRLNEFAVGDASWTRLRELSLRYVLNPPALKKAIGFRSIEFAASGRNLVIFTDVVGIDPDISQYGISRARGLDYFTNPGARTYAFSVKFNY